MSKEAMKLALEALERYTREEDIPWSQTEEAITALREALAKQPAQQEPVAWMHTKIDDIFITHRPADICRHPDRWMALYKDPTPCPTCEALARTVMLDQTYHDNISPQRTWVGLTDEELDEMFSKTLKGKKLVNWVARAIEAKLKEKNNG